MVLAQSGHDCTSVLPAAHKVGKANQCCLHQCILSGLCQLLKIHPARSPLDATTQATCEAHSTQNG